MEDSRRSVCPFQNGALHIRRFDVFVLFVRSLCVHAGGRSIRVVISWFPVSHLLPSRQQSQDFCRHPHTLPTPRQRLTMSGRRRSDRSRSMRPPASGHNGDLDSLRRKVSHLGKRLREEEHGRQVMDEDHDREEREWSRKMSKLEHELNKARQCVKGKNGLLDANEITIQDLQKQLTASQSDQEKLRKTSAKKDEEKAILQQTLESFKRAGMKTVRALRTEFGLDDDEYVEADDGDDKLSQDTLPMAAGAPRSGSSDDDFPEPASTPAALGPAVPMDAAHVAAAAVPPILPGNAAPAPADPVVVRVASEPS